MKSNILASIALFGVYRTKGWDTYDLVGQYIAATIAQKEYTSFTAATMKEDLKDLYQIDIPTGVIKSVARKKVNGVTLESGTFYCPRIPKDIIENEYNSLIAEYEDLFSILISFVNSNVGDKHFEDEDIRFWFADYLVDGYCSESFLNNVFAAFVSEGGSTQDIRAKIDLLSCGLISYNGLRYTDSSAGSNTWTDKLTVYLDTEFLFSCAGYNGEYYQQVFNELYDLVSEVNNSHRRRTGKEDNLIELKYLKDTRWVYSSIFTSIKQLMETNSVPDPSRKAIMKIFQESASVFDVDIHQSKIDTVIKDQFKIVYDDNDYGSFISDGRFILFDGETVSKLNETLNPGHDHLTTRKIDYLSRVLTIINGLRRGEDIQFFDKSRYIFLTGSKIGRSISHEVRGNNRSVPLATDIDFLVSRLWFRLNKQLVNNRIPASLDIVARSQAVLTRSITRNVRTLYDELVKKDLPDSQKKELYASLKAQEEFLEPYNTSSIKDVLTFIEYTSIDELMESQFRLKKKAAESEEKDAELRSTKEELTQTRQEAEEFKKQAKSTIDFYSKQQTEDTRTIRNQKHIIKLLIGLIVFVIVAVITVVFFF